MAVTATYSLANVGNTDVTSATQAPQIAGTSGGGYIGMARTTGGTVTIEARDAQITVTGGHSVTASGNYDIAQAANGEFAYGYVDGATVNLGTLSQEGNPTALTFSVTDPDSANLRVAGLSNGGFVAVTRDASVNEFGIPLTGLDIRTFDASGNIDKDFHIAPAGPNDLSPQKVIALDNGDFAVLVNMQGNKLTLLRFDPTGTVLLNQQFGFIGPSPGSQGDIVAVPGGGIVVLWSVNGLGGTVIRTLREYAADGSIVNEAVTNSSHGELTVLENGMLAIVNGSEMGLIDRTTLQVVATTTTFGETLAPMSLGRIATLGATATPDVEGRVVQATRTSVGDGASDTIVGDSFVDIMRGGGGGDVLSGGDNNDTLEGEAGIDILNGGSGADLLDGGDQHDTLNGGDGNDTLISGAGLDDQLFGGAHDDLVRTSTVLGNFNADGGSGIDTLDLRLILPAPAGTYSIELGGGNFNIFRNGSEYATATGFEHIILDDNNWSVLGTGDNNSLTGGAGNDTLISGTGNDTLIGGLGTDSLVGGDNNDVIFATHADGNDTITGGNGFDILDFSGVNGVVQINQLAGTVTGSAGNDTLIDVIEQIKGTAFGDVLSGGHGINVLDGEGGDDQFFANNGDDLVRGGTGNDTFFFSTSDGNDTLLGGDGFDVLDYSTLAGVVQVNQLAGTTTGTANNDILNDVFEQVIGTAFGDVLSGGHGINSLNGNGGDDQLFANNGEDYMLGGTGNDSLTGGLDHDRLDFRNGHGVDTWLDFTAGGTEDAVVLTFYSGLGSTSFDAAFQARLSTVSGHAELALNGGDRIIFQNVASHTSLTAADFIF